MTYAIAALAAGMCMGVPEPAHAQFGLGFGGFHFRFNIGPGWRGRYHKRRRGGSREESSESEESGKVSKEKSDKILASLGAPSSADQTRVLKSITASPVLGVVGSNKDLQDIGRPASKEDDRDYIGALDLVVGRLSDRQEKGLSTVGDITASGIEQSLLRAIKDAKLDTFERFASESWTPERVRKLVLDRIYNDLEPLFSGNVRGQVRMEALNPVIQEAANSTYRRLFETSELLATNRAANQFIQRLYQTTGGWVDTRTREIADTLVKKGASKTLARYDRMFNSGDNSYTYHYRAQRIVYDCLSENMEEITKAGAPEKPGEPGRPPLPETIEQRIKTISARDCERWLVAQFGDPEVPSAKVRAQTPVPLRVVWSKDGPVDDPSMYTRAANRY
ncbi:MAG: hypothetical protein WDO17_09705 [Alphaproteobacteria bacterium]